MATCNFAPMRLDMPMICGRTFEQAAASYLEETGDELTEDEFHNWIENDDFDDACYLAKEFSEDLTFYNVTVRGGYYTSFQFYVEERDGAEDIEDITNEDAHYYFDMCRSRAIRYAERERRKIYKWLLDLKSHGFNEVVITARFSNGETWYNIKQ